MRSRLEPSPCPNCGYVMDSATSLDGDETPSPGDFGICIKCHHLMVYGDDMRLRNPTDAELLDAAGEPEIVAAMRALDAYEQATGGKANE